MEYVFASFVTDIRKGWKSRPINHEIISTLFNSVAYVPYGYNVSKDTASLYMTRKRDIIDDVRSDASSKVKRDGIVDYFEQHVIPMLGDNKKKTKLQESVQDGLRKATNLTSDQIEEALSYCDAGLASFLGHVFLLVVSVDNRNSESSEQVHEETPPIDHYLSYLSAIKEEYEATRTLLYKDVPVPFYSFYVCNRIRRTSYIARMRKQGQVIREDDRSVVIEDCSAKYITALSKYIILKGTGGLGKSMMMRHLLLDAVRNYEGKESMVPVFVALKDYSTWNGEFEQYVFESISRFSDAVSIEVFKKDLKAGRYLLLFDGLDEIPTAYACQFEREIAGFLSRYKNNMYIISSRPISDFLPYNHFEVMQLEPLTKDQALTLIEKLDFRPDKPEIKAKFRSEVNSKLFISHYEFTSNPLLLTIMLMTFERFGTIPTKMHKFYSEAYQVLSETHDASKGAYQRVFKTGLDSDRMETYFSEFCARTYMAEQFEVSDDAAKDVFNRLTELKKKKDTTTQFSKFMGDVCDNLCLMYHENGKYHFMHRSFQEYFSALFFSRQMDDTLLPIAQSFEKKKGRHGTDLTFGMLYDMITEKIEKKVFIPTLESLFDKCDHEYGYWTFLRMMYPSIRYSIDNIGDDRVHQYPSSFLYRFIARMSGYYHYDEESPCVLPYIEELIEKRYIEIPIVAEDEETHSTSLWSEVFPEDEVPEEFEDYVQNGSDPVGFVLAIDVNQLPAEQMYDEDSICRKGRTQEEKSPYNPELYEGDYKELIQLVSDEHFPLRIEYELMRGYLGELKERYAERTEGDDLFNLF